MTHKPKDEKPTELIDLTGPDTLQPLNNREVRQTMLLPPMSQEEYEALFSAFTFHITSPDSTCDNSGALDLPLNDFAGLFGPHPLGDWGGQEALAGVMRDMQMLDKIYTFPPCHFDAEVRIRGEFTCEGGFAFWRATMLARWCTVLEDMARMRKRFEELKEETLISFEDGGRS